MWNARNKTDLAIEVWEKLDCESVGAVEIEAIETAVGDVFGKSAVDSPMIIARLLADEGAELRHSEIMQLYVRRASERQTFEAALRNVLDTADLKKTLTSIRRLETFRKKYEAKRDQDSLRFMRSLVVDEKEKQLAAAGRQRSDPNERMMSREIAEWLTLWLQSPELFENWLTLRRRSPDFVSKFGEL